LNSGSCAISQCKKRATTTTVGEEMLNRREYRPTVGWKTSEKDKCAKQKGGIHGKEL
jgi:hypothetical protein